MTFISRPFPLALRTWLSVTFNHSPRLRMDSPRRLARQRVPLAASSRIARGLPAGPFRDPVWRLRSGTNWPPPWNARCADAAKRSGWRDFSGFPGNGFTSSWSRRPPARTPSERCNYSRGGKLDAKAWIPSDTPRHRTSLRQDCRFGRRARPTLREKSRVVLSSIR